MALVDFLAAASKIDSGEIGIPTAIKSADTTLVSVLNTAYQWAGILAVVIVIVAGFIYTTSDGNAARIKQAKDAIMGAVLGIIFIMMAFVITQYVIGRF